MHHFVYMTTNIHNGKRYIGKHSTPDIDDGYLGSGLLLQRALKKYGKSLFVREVLYESDNVDEVLGAEKEYIQYFDAVNNPMFYNLALGGEGGDTYTGVSESEKLRRAALTSNYLKGKAKSSDHRAALSAAKMGQPRNWSPETVKRYSDNRKKAYTSGEYIMPKGNRGNKNFRHDETTKDALRESLQARHQAAKNRGEDYVSPAGKAIAKQKREKYWTPEAREAHAEKLRAAHARRRESLPPND